MTAERLSVKNSFRNTILFGITMFLMFSANFFMVMGGYFYETAADMMLAANIVLNIAILWDLFLDVRRNFPMLVFVGSFDLLLMGRVYIAFFRNYSQILYYVEAENYENLFCALQIVTVSLLCVYAAYKLSAPLFAKKENKLRKEGRGAVRKTALTPVIRQLSEAVLLISSIAFFLILFQSILNVRRYGYLGSFTVQADSNIPSAISRLSMFFVPSFAVFLATLPSRRQMKLPFAVYGVYMLASLFTGRRNVFVCEALMLLIYCVLRDNLRRKDKRIFKKGKIFWAIVAVVILMYLLQLIAEYRANTQSPSKGFFYLVMNFVYSQGASFRVVIQTVNHWDLFDHTTSYRYLFYPFELYAHNNLVIRTIFGFSPITEIQTANFGQTTFNFAHALTYLVDPDRYLSGGGFGTSFVAEAYVAFGMGGTAVVSALVGVILRFFSSMLTRNWVVIACSLLAVKDIVYMPRSFAFSWVTDVFSITYLCFFVGIYLIALLLVWFGAHIRRAKGPCNYTVPEEEL